jgi:hypothetical protein
MRAGGPTMSCSGRGRASHGASTLNSVFDGPRQLCAVA